MITTVETLSKSAGGVNRMTRRRGESVGKRQIMETRRLIEYFMVFGASSNQVQSDGSFDSSPQVIDRYPIQEREDVPLPANAEMVWQSLCLNKCPHRSCCSFTCQTASRWQVSRDHRASTFSASSTLKDIDSMAHVCVFSRDLSLKIGTSRFALYIILFIMKWMTHPIFISQSTSRKCWPFFPSISSSKLLRYNCAASTNEHRANSNHL